MIKKILLRTLIIISALIIILLIFLPGIIKRYSINHSKELIGRQIEFKKLRLNYFTGMIRITDFVMFEEDQKQEFITFDTLIVNLEPFQLFIDEMVMESFYLKGLDVNIIQRDSTFNFDDLLAFHSSAEEAVPDDTSNVEPFHFQLSNIELLKAQLSFEDMNINKTTILNDISFFVPFIGWNQEEKSEAGLRFAFKNEGYFESSIKVDPLGGEFDAEITVYHLYLNTFREYASEYIDIGAIEGFYNSDIHIMGNINDVENSIVSGFAEIIDLEMMDLENTKFLGAQKIACVLKEINIAKASFVIDSLVLDHPYAYFEMDTASNNLAQIFRLEQEDPDTILVEVSSSTDSTESIVPLFYAINNISINDGVIDYTDNLTGEAFEYYLSNIILNTDSIYSTSDWINLTSEMQLNNRGTLKAEVGLNPADPLDIDLNYVVKDFQLSDINIYSRFYMGFPIVYGDMYYKSDTRIKNGQLSSENRLVINHVELGDKTGGLYDLPMKFALFLLKDRDGVINLDVPVSGDLNDPRVSVGKIVWTTFKNLIVKVATSPFDALARLLSVDPKDIESIEYEYTDTLLTTEKQRQIDLLLELEQNKEGLNIELVYFNDVEQEKAVIALREMQKKFRQQTEKDPAQHEDLFNDFVFNQLPTDTLDLNSACLKLTDSELTESLSVHYANSRIEQIKRQLAFGNDSTKIGVRAANIKSPKNTGSQPIFEVKYSIDDENESIARDD